MPALSNPRWERFAHCIWQGLGDEYSSQGRAYVAAGYNAKDAGKRGGSAEAAASRLLKRVKPILDRVKELQREEAKRAKVTVQTIANELDEARAIALEEKQASAAVAATTTKGKLYGLFVDRQEQGKPGDFSTAQTTDDLASRMLKDAGAEIITEAMRKAVIEEMVRHQHVIAFLAANETTHSDTTSEGEKPTSASVSAKHYVIGQSTKA